MDTKLKNNRKIRGIVTVIALVLISVATVFLYPEICGRADRQLEEWGEERESEFINGEVIDGLCQGAYVLFYEQAQREGTISAADLFFVPQYEENTLAMETVGQINALKEEINSKMEQATSEFDQYRMDIDYCVILGKGKYEKNTGQALEAVYENPSDAKTIGELREYYNNYFVLQYDGNGILTVSSVYSQNLDAGMMIKTLGQYDRGNTFWEELKQH